MKVQRESFQLVQEYWGIERRTMLLFLGLVLGTLFVVTVTYVLIFGVDTWTNNMKQAGTMMFANLNTPNEVLERQGENPGGQPVGMTNVKGAVQYSCPTCGPIGLPTWDTDGAPHCPNCGLLMTNNGP